MLGYKGTTWKRSGSTRNENVRLDVWPHKTRYEMIVYEEILV